MIARSLLSLGNTARIERALKKAASGEDVTIAFIERFSTGSNMHFIKAGVGGTSSELGVVRFDKDVMRGAESPPDIVIVEFAVNDEADETKGDCYESLVRKILKLPGHPAVVLLFSVFADDWNLQERLSRVGTHYELPMISIKDAVTPQFWLKEGKGRVLSKNQFFYDMFHPSNIGHRIMVDCLINLFECTRTNISEGRGMEDATERLLRKEPVIGNTFCGGGSERTYCKDLSDDRHGGQIFYNLGIWVCR